MAACSASTGVPVSVLRKSSKAGCPAFDSHHRINFGVWLRWFFEHESAADDMENWGDRLKRAQALREEGKLEQDRKSVVARDFVEQIIQRAISVLFARLDRVFCSELPPVIKGMDELAIRERAIAAMAEARNGAREDFAEFANG